MLWHARRRGLGWWRYTDAAAVLLPLTMMLGRGANYINGELWGMPTAGDWGVIFPHVDEVPRHPAQLYAVGKNLVLLCLGWGTYVWQKRGHWRWGRLTGVFLLGYGVMRTVLQVWFRAPTQLVGGVPVGLVLSVVTAGLGLGVLGWVYLGPKKIVAEG